MRKILQQQQFTRLLLLALLMGSGTMWGQTITIVPNASATGNSTNGYVSAETAFTSASINWKINNWNPTTLQMRGNTTVTSNFYFSNTVALPGDITKITITNSNATLVASKVFLLVGSAEQTGTANGTAAGTATTTSSSVSWSPAAGSKFFKIYLTSGGTSGTALMSNIKIEYALPTATPVVTPATISGNVGTALPAGTGVTASNSPTSYTYTGTIPAGLSFSTSTGSISGTPAVAANNTTISVTATNGSGTSDPVNLTFNIAKGDQTIMLASTANAQYGTTYTYGGTTTSGLALSYTSSNPAVATASGSTVTIVGQGTTTITASQAGNTNWNAATNATQNLTVTQKQLTLTGVSIVSKEYDGNTYASITGTPSLVGVISADTGNVTLVNTAASATFSSAAVGTHAVTISGYAITGSASGNYTLIQPTGITGTINAKNVTISGITAQNKPYDATTTATFNTGYTINGIISPDVVTVTGAFTNANAGDNKTVNLTLSGAATGNYNLASPTTVTANITKIAHPGFTTNAITTGLTTYTIGTANVASASDGALSYTSSNNAVFTVSGATITGVAPGNATLYVNQAAGTNYLATTTAAQVAVTVTSVTYTQNDWRTRSTGTWGTANNSTGTALWQKWNGSAWENQTTNPTSSTPGIVYI
ncbi:MAG: hypothetical protein EOP54_19505, partial [Sphingobacteriales bacterium]